MSVEIEKVGQTTRVIVDTTNEGDYSRRTIFKENLSSDHPVHNYQPIAVTKLTGVFEGKTRIDIPAVFDPSKTGTITVTSTNSAEEIIDALKSVGMRKLEVGESAGRKVAQFFGL